MTLVERHEKDCPICQSGYKDDCCGREALQELDELQAAVALWPKLPPHGPFCACLQRTIDPCDCDHSKRNAARAKARHLLGMDPC